MADAPGANTPTEQIHASCVSINGQGVLITGEPGSGKSDLCLRLIEGGATLIADDRVILQTSPEGLLTARAPERLKGLLEARGIGILMLPYEESAPLALVVEATEISERIPQQEERRTFAGASLPCIRLNLLHASTAAKTHLALAVQLGQNMQQRKAAEQ